MFGYDFDFVIRHRFETAQALLDGLSMWRNYELGFWFRKSKAVGRKDFKHVKEWKNNMCNTYTLGVNLIWVKTWIHFSKGVMNFKE